MAMPSAPSTIPARGPPQRIRGRVYNASNDVLNGISGMEHLSNSL